MVNFNIFYIKININYIFINGILYNMKTKKQKL